MILYKNQLVLLNRLNEPGIFLGVDGAGKNNSKYWIFRLTEKDKSKGFIDDFYPTGLNYLKIPHKEVPSPTTGKKIFFGKYVRKNYVFPFFIKDTALLPAPPEDLVKYINEVMSKFEK